MPDPRAVTAMSMKLGVKPRKTTLFVTSNLLSKERVVRDQVK
jgi:hypothetical protein